MFSFLQNFRRNLFKGVLRGDTNEIIGAAECFDEVRDCGRRVRSEVGESSSGYIWSHRVILLQTARQSRHGQRGFQSQIAKHCGGAWRYCGVVQTTDQHWHGPAGISVQTDDWRIDLRCSDPAILCWGGPVGEQGHQRWEAGVPYVPQREEGTINVSPSPPIPVARQFRQLWNR